MKGLYVLMEDLRIMRFLKSGQDSHKTDDEIITSFKKTRDPQLIGILFDRYSHLIFAVSMKYLKNEEDSKDAVLQIFENIMKDFLRVKNKYTHE